MDTTTAPQTLGEHIRAHRTHLGLSQHDLSMRTGIHQGSLSFYEADKATPTLRSLALLRDGLDWDAADVDLAVELSAA